MPAVIIYILKNDNRWRNNGISAGSIDFNPSVDQTESKIKDFWNKNKQIVHQEINVGDVIGIFIPDWHKFIRGTLEERFQNGLLNVFAIDYGVPMSAQQERCFKLPLEFGTMDPRGRIHLGGIRNCVPAEKQHDMFTDEISILMSTLNLSEKAIIISKNEIESGIHYKFENVDKLNVSNHSFGYLKIQRTDETWIDLSEYLINNGYAKETTKDWNEVIRKLDSVKETCGKIVGAPIQNIGTDYENQPLLEAINGSDPTLNSFSADYNDTNAPSTSHYCRLNVNGPNHEAVASNESDPISNRSSGDNNGTNAPSTSHHSALNTNGQNNEAEASNESDPISNNFSEDNGGTNAPSTSHHYSLNANVQSNDMSVDPNDATVDQMRPNKRKRLELDSDNDDNDDNDDSDDNDESEQHLPKKHGRKNIRDIIDNFDLAIESKEAVDREEERIMRVTLKKRTQNQIIKIEDKLVLDFDLKTKKDLLSVDTKLVKFLKLHQKEGVKFMWDACFESMEKINDNDAGGGCILAHCMGLGKTLQVITLIHTLLTHGNQTKVKNVLILCPASITLNWVNEFNIWLEKCDQNRYIKIYEFSKFKASPTRSRKLNEWHTNGGVLILSYTMYRNLSLDSKASKKVHQKHLDIFDKCLAHPGPDLIVCDEGHVLKNDKSLMNKAMHRLRPLRRIILTGTPLQNNLNEYHCMVSFVKPSLLGTEEEYKNRFVNPIKNGQFSDSTPEDIQLMKARSHILHKTLDGCVHRRDYSVLAVCLPPKHEFVVYIQLTELQVNLYKHYMKMNGPISAGNICSDYHSLRRICTHPRVLKYYSDEYQNNGQKKKCITDIDFDPHFDPDLDPALDSLTTLESFSAPSVHLETRPKGKQSTDTAEQCDSMPNKRKNPMEWWMALCPNKELDNIENSGKLMLLFSILAECEARGDKLLVFTMSLLTLNVIEHFLSTIDKNTKNPNPDNKLGGFTGSWTRGIDYHRIDGSVSLETRYANCNDFNEENSKVRLLLISTLAGGQGINLVGANRVIIFDPSWNPAIDNQSFFRVYRYGQKKPTFIYRFIALGTMEEKVYDRQITKLATSKRVVDEHQIDRHFKQSDLFELYNYKNIVLKYARPKPIEPKDTLFAKQLQKHPGRIFKYHEHDLLLENKQEETLSKADMDKAWSDFKTIKIENEKDEAKNKLKAKIKPNFSSKANF